MDHAMQMQIIQLTIQLWIKNTFQLDFAVKQFRLVLRSKKAPLVFSRTGISSHV